MNEAYVNLLATEGASVITHIGLVNASGVELSGGSPAYARMPVAWTVPVAGKIYITADQTFNIPLGAVVAGWHGFTALTGGTDYGGKDLTPETFAEQGQYKLLAAGTGINHANVV